MNQEKYFEEISGNCLFSPLKETCSAYYLDSFPRITGLETQESLLGSSFSFWGGDGNVKAKSPPRIGTGIGDQGRG